MNLNYINLYQNLVSQVKKQNDKETKKLIKKIDNIDHFIELFISQIQENNDPEINLLIMKLIIKHHFWEVNTPPENLDKYIDDLKLHSSFFDLITEFISGKKKLLVMEQNIFSALDNIKTSRYLVKQYPLLKLINKKTQIMDFNILLLEKIIPLARSIYDNTMNIIPGKIDLDQKNCDSAAIFGSQVSERISKTCQIFGHQFLKNYKIFPIISLKDFNENTSYSEKIKIFRHAGNRIIGILKSMSDYIEDYRNKRTELKQLIN